MTKQIDNIASVEPLLVEILSIQNPSDNEITKWQAIDKVKSLLPKRFFIEEDSYGNLLFDNRPVKKRTEPVPTIIAHLDQVHEYARGFRLALLGDKLVAYDYAGRRVGTGGDDKCGIYVLIKLLLSDIPCRAIVTQDEEIGLLGTAKITSEWGKQSSILLQADRRGCNDLIKHTNGNLIASDELVARVLALPECAGMKPEYGSVTDVGDLADLFQVAGFNISAGYYDAHSHRESIKLSELHLCLARVMAICRMVGSEVQEYPEQPVGGRYGFSYGSYNGGGGLGSLYDDDDDFNIVIGNYYMTEADIVIGPMFRVGGCYSTRDTELLEQHVLENYEYHITDIIWQANGQCRQLPEFDIKCDSDGYLIPAPCELIPETPLPEPSPLPDGLPPLPPLPDGSTWLYYREAVGLPHPYVFLTSHTTGWISSSKNMRSTGGAEHYAVISNA